MSQKDVLLIRADASAQIGTGHVMRCVALAKGWQALGGNVLFAMATYAPALARSLDSEGLDLVCLDVVPGDAGDSSETAALAHSQGADWVVVDGYHFGTEYHRAIRSRGHRLLVLDDYGHTDQFLADLVLNPNISADERLYARRAPHTRLLLGTKYVLLRPEFWPWRTWKRDIPAVSRKVLVTLGGSDPVNATLKVMHSLKRLVANGTDAIIVVGGSNPRYEQLHSVARGWSGMCLCRDVRDMPRLMAWADIAVSAGGGTCWELAYMGLPSVVLVLAENQRPIADGLERAGVAVNAGSHSELCAADIAEHVCTLAAAQAVRQGMSERGRCLVDGRGVHRVLAHLTGVHLRPVEEADARLLWEWANDPDVRSASFHMETIPWDRHVQWFESKLLDPNCVAYVAETRGPDATAIGQVRFDVTGKEAVVSISVDQRYRHRGYGAKIIWFSSHQLLDTLDVVAIHAYIKPDNVASRQAFLKAGYQTRGRVVVGDCEARHLVLQRGQ